ncbi:LPS assembly lipoprotein LptE [Undibacterium sp.]|jgi:LPS-assembly lipoprotein|uniref:LPS-assembly lipoprotein LptE n=1 Tax=Undibacterium sp. TaxID=1914977 RepID=UPI002CC8EC06|nr:LPS assembly lipoprotein LptE [Undibacterium sp.]HTD04585.1 LPS assembly lipoprotein LptE [Undibacterium sp.]
MRRSLSRSAQFASLFALALMLSACGFAMRGAVSFPFKSIYVGFGEASPLGSELKRNIRANGHTIITSSPNDAEVILDVLAENREKVILSLNSQGRVREYNLQYTFRFRVRDKAGKELLAPTDIALKRNISFNESQVLAKEAEEAVLYRDMQTDLVQQIMRRLAVLNMS